MHCNSHSPLFTKLSNDDSNTVRGGLIKVTYDPENSDFTVEYLNYLYNTHPYASLSLGINYYVNPMV